MAYVLQNYHPEKSNIVFGNTGSQKLLLGSSTFRDMISKNIYPISMHGKNSVDNSWQENGHTYLANTADGKLYKLDQSGDIVSSRQFTYPSAISVIQGGVLSLDVAGEANEYYDEEYGALVIDDGDKAAYKIDKDLNIEFEMGGVENPIAISGAIKEYGFYIADDQYEKIIKFDQYGNHVSYVDYSFFDPAISTSNRIISLKQGWDGSFWILTQLSYLYNVQFDTRERPTIAKKININVDFSSYYTRYLPSGMDIDHFGKCVFLTMGVESEFIMLKYPNPNKEPLMIQYGPYYNMGYPCLLKVGQGKNSQSVFVLTGTPEDPDPEGPWTSSTSSESESSIEPGILFAASTGSARINQIDLNSFAVTFSGKHMTTGTKAFVYSQTENKLYYMSYSTSNLYSYDFSSNLNALVGDTGISDIIRMCMSPDESEIWMSKESTIYIVNKSSGAITHTASLKTHQMGDIASNGGMEINPYDDYLYIADGQAIYKTDSANINNLVIVVEKVVNKSSLTNNYINDIAFGNDGAMFVIDYENLSSRIFQVKYLDASITYSLFSQYSGQLIEAITNGNL